MVNNDARRGHSRGGPRANANIAAPQDMAENAPGHNGARGGVHRASGTGHKAVVVVTASTPAPTLTAPRASWMMNKASRNESARNNL